MERRGIYLGNGRDERERDFLTFERVSTSVSDERDRTRARPRLELTLIVKRARLCSICLRIVSSAQKIHVSFLGKHS